MTNDFLNHYQVCIKQKKKKKKKPEKKIYFYLPQSKSVELGSKEAIPNKRAFPLAMDMRKTALFVRVKDAALFLKDQKLKWPKYQSVKE